MRRRRLFPTLLPVAAALLLLSLPAAINVRLRNYFANAISPIWALLHIENRHVQLESSKQQEYQDWLEHHESSNQQTHKQAVSLLQQMRLEKALIGQVLYRSQQTWNSSLWINLGDDDNPQEGTGTVLIAKNSPVLSGDSVIGVVDFVGKKTSLVRLITDSGLTPAVRVGRGGIEERCITREIEELSDYVKNHSHAFKKEEERAAFLFLLEELAHNTLPERETQFLAKGELQGHGYPLWRAPGKLLRGLGFNYDFKDANGPARDLRTGEPIDPEEEYAAREKTPIIQVNDLLVTSGMDGVFPEGLKVARVHWIAPLREGAYSYDILAKPTAGDLMELKTVIVLPPQGLETSLLPNKSLQITGIK